MKKIDKYIQKNIRDVNNKIIIITGANSGIGFAAAKILASKGAHLVLTCRSSERAEKARIQILEKFPNAVVDIELYNQASINSTMDFVNTVEEKYPNLYALILNAGVYHPKKGLKTNEGYPLTSGVNFFGSLLIVEMLQEFLSAKQTETRIIFQSSLTARASKKYKKQNFEKAYLSGSYGRSKQYNLSKYGVFNVFNFYKNRNENPKVKYLCAEPGVAKTNIIRSFPKWFKFIANPFMSIVFHSTDVGSLPLCYLATNKVANGDFVIPSRLCGVKGYPTYHNVKEKYMSDELIMMALLEISNG